LRVSFAYNKKRNVLSIEGFLAAARRRRRRPPATFRRLVYHCHDLFAAVCIPFRINRFYFLFSLSEGSLCRRRRVDDSSPSLLIAVVPTVRHDDADGSVYVRSEDRAMHACL
jgi:hypothetical protein